MKSSFIRGSVVVKMLLVGVTLLFSSCFSLYSPVSDVHMLRNKRMSKPRTMGISMATSITGAGVRTALENKYQTEDTGHILAVRNRFGTAVASAFGNEKFSYGFGVGGTVGIDATFAAGSNILLTGSANLKRNYEGVIQYIIPKDDISAIGLGIFFRSERHGIVGEDCERSTEWFCIDKSVDRYFRIDAAGVRFATYANNTPVRFYLGYSPEINQLVVIANLTFVRADR